MMSKVQEEVTTLLGVPAGNKAGSVVRTRSISTILLWVGIAVLIAAGWLAIYREIAILWVVWTTDPLRSIGILIFLTSVVLTLRVWRQFRWDLRGTWWGLCVIGLSYFLSYLHQDFRFTALVGKESVSIIPTSLPLYVYGCGVVLLFAGWRVWRAAWFPLGLLVLSQPVPSFISGALDIPFQTISAQVARSFATLINFAPTTPQLRLMFSPDFGMFIAPGCDGIRGAITMGYVALLMGYLKRASWHRWVAYVTGAVLLGYLLNFLRLCALVLYYRLALGHPLLEGLAKQADYVIGSCLFMVAVLLFLRVALRNQPDRDPLFAPQANSGSPLSFRDVCVKGAALGIVFLIALPLPSSVLRFRPAGTVDPTSLASHFPKTIGDFALNRTWYEQMGGAPVEVNGAYRTPGSEEVILGVWIAPLLHTHDANLCWLARGLRPDTFTSKRFNTAQGTSIDLGTGYYSDGITDSIVVNALCSPTSCTHASVGLRKWIDLEAQRGEPAGSGAHLVSLMVRIDKLHSAASKEATYRMLSDEADKFLNGLDALSLSRAFQ